MRRTMVLTIAITSNDDPDSVTDHVDKELALMDGDGERWEVIGITAGPLDSDYQGRYFLHVALQREHDDD